MAEKRPSRVLGPHHDDFWKYCAGGRVASAALQRVQLCVLAPHRGVLRLRDRGRLHLGTLLRHGEDHPWCRFERPYYRETLPVPWDAILVKLDEGPIFLSNPKGLCVRRLRTTAPREAGVYRLRGRRRGIQAPPSSSACKRPVKASSTAGAALRSPDLGASTRGCSAGRRDSPACVLTSSGSAR